MEESFVEGRSRIEPSTVELVPTSMYIILVLITLNLIYSIYFVLFTWCHCVLIFFSKCFPLRAFLVKVVKIDIMHKFD